MDKRLIISRLGITLTGLLIVVALTGNALAGPGDSGGGGPGGPGGGGGTGGAVTNPVTASPTSPITTAQGVVDKINTVAGFLFAVFLALAVIFLIVAGLFYLTAAGNQTQLDKAKNTLIYSIVAIVIALIAGGVAAFIGNILGTRAL